MFSVLEAVAGPVESLANLSRTDAIVTAMKLASALSGLRESLQAGVEPLLAAAELGDEAEAEIAANVDGIDKLQEQLDSFAARLEQAAERRAQQQQRYDHLQSLEQQVQEAEGELEHLAAIQEKEQEWIARRDELQAQVDSLKARVEREAAPVAALKNGIREESGRFIRLSEEALAHLDNDTAVALQNASGLDERLQAARAKWMEIEEKVPDVLKKVEALRAYEQANSEVAAGLGTEAKESVEPLLEQVRGLLKSADDSLRAVLQGKEAVAQVRLPFAPRKAEA
jgi:chromosome segregation ATPase